MNIVVISDTHGSLGAWNKVEKYINSDTSCVIHAGDIYYFGPRNPVPEGHAPGSLAERINNLRLPVICAKGNCDSDVDQLVSKFPLCNPFAFVFYYGRKIFVTHGHMHEKEKLVELGKSWSVDIIVTGHTHFACLEKIDDIIFLNPGSCSLPKNFPGIGLIYDNFIELRNLVDGSVVEKVNLTE
ncbi:MAG: phosphodiesterase [Candidatus Ratteibacteria bacterium]